jgi:hypothetical protein
MRSSLNVRIEATPMYYRGSLSRIVVRQSTNGQEMRGHLFSSDNMKSAKEYVRSLAGRFPKANRVKVIWPFE